MQARRLRYVLISSFLVQYSAVRAATLVHPQRDDLAGRSFLEVGIPLETYTNGLVFYMDAAAGDYNAGETDYFIPDLSTNHNDATQTGTGYQPTRVFTNGAWAYQFDGVDDCFNIPAITSTRSVTRVSADIVLRSSDLSFTLFGGGVLSTGVGAGCYSSSGNARLICRSGNAAETSYVQSVPTVSAIKPLFDDETHSVVFESTTTNTTWWFDGVQYGPYAFNAEASSSAIISYIGRHNQGSLGQRFNRADIQKLSIELIQ